MRFNEAILEFGFDCRARKLSDKTISNYQKQLRYLERYLGVEYGITEVEDVRSLHLKEFLVSMDEKGRKPRYINDLLKVFKTFFNYLKREAYIRESPAAKVHNIPSSFLKNYAIFMEGKMNVSELARVCGLSRPTVYKYMKMMG